MARTKGKGRYTRSTIKKVVRDLSETKQISQLVDTTVSTSVHGVELSKIAQGTGTDQRIGNRIYIKGVKARLVYAPDSTDAHNMIRTYVVTSFNENEGVGSLPTDFINSVNHDKYKVHRDFVTTLYATGVSNASLVKKYKKMWIPINKYFRFDGTANNNYTGNVLLAGFVSDSGVVGHPFIEGNFTVYYKDV